MFDKLEDLVARLDELQNELSDPNVASNAERFRNLMKEQANLAPIVEKYQEYKEAKQTIEDSLSMLEGESDEEMREMLKEELSSAKQQVEKCENELKILLLPKDPNDERNVILEIRAGAGGDEAALFAAELYRMYVHYAESRRWKVELMEADLRKSQVGTGDRSEKIRTYNFPQGRVTDHRIGLTLYKLDKIMNGDIQEIIDACIAADQAAKLAKMNEE